MTPDQLWPLLEAWGHPAVFLLLLLNGVGSPLPEEAVLLTAGYLATAGVLDWSWVGAAAFCGVVGSDLILFAAGRRLAWHASQRQDAWMPSPARLRQATRWFDRCGNAIILLARLVPGTRAIVYLTAGVRHVDPVTFAAWDIAGALLWVPLMLVLGREAEQHLGDIGVLTGWIGWLLLAAAVAATAWLALRRPASTP